MSPRRPGSSCARLSGTVWWQAGGDCRISCAPARASRASSSLSGELRLPSPERANSRRGVPASLSPPSSPAPRSRSRPQGSAPEPPPGRRRLTPVAESCPHPLAPLPGAWLRRGEFRCLQPASARRACQGVLRAQQAFPKTRVGSAGSGAPGASGMREAEVRGGSGSGSSASQVTFGWWEEGGARERTENADRLLATAGYSSVLPTRSQLLRT